MSRILGLDLGTSSIGWAVVNDEDETIFGMGTRIFPEGVENLGDGEGEISKNATRRDARSSRRQFFRRRVRKNYLLKILASHNMCPFEKEEIKTWNTDRLFARDEVRDWLALNPYELRNRALDQKVSLHELGRIFYHLIQRRGYQSNSRSAGDEDGAIYEGKPKEGKKGILETRDQIKDQTLGQFLHKLYPEDGESYKEPEDRIRNRYTTRQMYIDEFESIWTNQATYHKELTDELKAAIGGRTQDGYKEDGVLFHQRPLRSQKHLVGKCTFEPSKPKCLRSSIVFELFRMYQWVNTVECNGKKLNIDDREKLIEQLKKKAKVKFSVLRKAINKEGSEFQFNYKNDDQIAGSLTISKLSSKKIFGNRWDDFTLDEQEAVWHDLYFYDDKEKLKKRGEDQWGLSEEQAADFCKFRLGNGNDQYSHLSRKAILNILPFLKQGFTYDTAVTLGGIKNAFGAEWERLDPESKTLISDNIWDIMHQNSKGGYINTLRKFLSDEFGMTDKQLKKLYHHSTNIRVQELLEKLPVGRDADIEIQSIKNPVVIAALFELRKVVNELIDRFGSFDQIKIELARDLKISKSKRNDIRREQKRLERENDRVKKELINAGQDISHSNILKFKLWEECNKTCPFTGRSIEFNQLFSGDVQIEHIHPWSKSLNDSFMNKTLCFADENRAKGDRTPYEFYHNEQGKEKWEQIKAQALSCFKNKPNYPKAYLKFKQFIKQKHDSDFKSRQLNDTRYISREAKSYLSKICRDIVVAPGQMTSNLRSKWGLNSILSLDDEKSREDHRHHAVDALVMACTNVGYLQELSRWNRYHRSYDLKEFPLPWEDFRQQVDYHVNRILISHRKTNTVLTRRTHKTTKNGKTYFNTGIAARGQLHKETVFGKRKTNGGAHAYHVRKPLESITTKKQVEKIVDPVVRGIIHRRIEKMGGFEKGKNVPNETFFRADEEGRKIPMIHLPNKNGDPVPVKKVRLRENLGGAEQLRDINQFVNPRNNHHVLIYRDNKGNLKEDTVTFWTAVERKTQGEPVVKLPDDGEEFVTTLQINDMFVIGLPEESPDVSRFDTDVIGAHLYRVQKVSEGYYVFRHHLASTLNFPDQECRIQSLKKWQELNPVKVRITPSGLLKVY